MATMRELAGMSSPTSSTNIQSTALGNVNPSQVQAQQIQDSSLSEFQAGIKGLQQTAGAVYTGVEDARKLRASDRYTNYLAGMKEIDKFYSDKEGSGKALTSKDIQNKIDWQNRFHKDMVTGGIDLEEDINTTTYKDTFISPATDVLFKTNKVDSSRFLELDKVETIVKYKKEIDVSGINITPDTISLMVDSLKQKGVQYPEDALYSDVSHNFNVMFNEKFKDGYSSKSLIPYLENGVFTENSKSMLFNDIFKKFITRDSKTGEYSKVDNNLTDEAESSMLKSFSSWANGLEDKTPVISMQTVSKTNSTTKVTEAPSMISKRIDESYSQIVQLKNAVTASGGSTKTVATYTKALQDFEELNQKLVQSEKLTSTYNQFLKGDYSNLEDITYEHKIFNPINLSPTTSSSVLKADDIANFIGEKTFNDYSDAIKNGDSENASRLLYSLGRLETMGYSTPQSSTINTRFGSQINTSMQIDNATNINTLMAVLDSTIGYKSVTGLDAPHLTKTIKDNVYNFYSDQKKLMENGGIDENGNPITETSTLRKTKIFYRIESRRVSMALKENQRENAGMILGMNRSDSLGDEMDSYVHGEIFGWKLGEAEFADNSLNVGLSIALENGASSRKELGDRLKSSIVKLDNSYLPIFGSSLAVVNPTSLSESKFQENFKDVINYQIGQYQSVKNIDFADIVDEKVSLTQQRIYNSSTDKQETMTVVHILDNAGNKIHSILITPDELTAGITSKKKQSMNINNVKDTVVKKEKGYTTTLGMLKDYNAKQ